MYCACVFCTYVSCTWVNCKCVCCTFVYIYIHYYHTDKFIHILIYTPAFCLNITWLKVSILSMYLLLRHSTTVHHPDMLLKGLNPSLQKQFGYSSKTGKSLPCQYTIFIIGYQCLSVALKPPCFQKHDTTNLWKLPSNFSGGGQDFRPQNFWSKKWCGEHQTSL